MDYCTLFVLILQVCVNVRGLGSWPQQVWLATCLQSRVWLSTGMEILSFQVRASSETEVFESFFCCTWYTITVQRCATRICYYVFTTKNLLSLSQQDINYNFSKKHIILISCVSVCWCLSGRRFVINQKQISTMDALLNDITHNIGAPLAVRTLYTPRCGHRVSDLTDLQQGAQYVAAGFERFKKLEWVQM